MHSQVVSLRLGSNVSCCTGLRDFRLSESKPTPHVKVITPFRIRASKILEDLLCRRKLPVSRTGGTDFVNQIRESIAPSRLDTDSGKVKETFPASRAHYILQSFWDRWSTAIPQGWSPQFSSRGISLILALSVVTSPLYLRTPTADAFGFFGLTGAGNQAISRSNTNSQNDVQDNEAYRAKISMAIDLLEKGQNAQAQGDFGKALDFYEELKQTAGDLALAEYARVGHAVTLYEVGDRNEAITEMEDVSVALKGYPEIHAALAAALYVDKHAPLPAEKQFNIATLLDPRYTNLKWVEENKHWPPSLINSLKRFITLQ
ncbi:hypothetical protein R1sor_013138 [Riccia sorocarpa]|uniref:Uncharacterized protein n=1 Tax=Riccia sorocarpa TaxID=122646 RepID=A0ABD3H9L6_9MARC